VAHGWTKAVMGVCAVDCKGPSQINWVKGLIIYASMTIVFI